MPMLKPPITERLELQAYVKQSFERVYIDLPASEPTDSRAGSECADRDHFKFDVSTKRRK